MGEIVKIWPFENFELNIPYDRVFSGLSESLKLDQQN